jgi:hypothetical protein
MEAAEEARELSKLNVLSQLRLFIYTDVTTLVRYGGDINKHTTKKNGKCMLQDSKEISLQENADEIDRALVSYTKT